MSIYFIQGENGGPIKIGQTDYSPFQRLTTLQTGSPIRLKLLVAIPGGKKQEAELHARFQHLRSHGEWFTPDAELLSLIEHERTLNDIEAENTDIQPLIPSLELPTRDALEVLDRITRRLLMKEAAILQRGQQ